MGVGLVGAYRIMFPGSTGGPVVSIPTPPASTAHKARTLVPVRVRGEVEPALELRGQLRHVRLGERAWVDR